ncbi:predicted protein [Nematostella vectensis]|uniref:Uncharacterized protein n=1 Tax=Nematostella vectensis TaxID=45351 RepID=A7S866_NEMVE|nr:predicted protein [Nematostella vectensis]|eukprot:XP_001632175.1 predicted protein [Nematostella vectensis]
MSSVEDYMKEEPEVEVSSIPKDDEVKRESLAILATLGATKEYVGVNISLGDISRLQNSDVEKYYNRYQTVLGKKVSSGLVESAIQVASHVISYLVPVDDAEALSKDLQNDELVKRELTNFAGLLVLRVVEQITKDPLPRKKSAAKEKDPRKVAAGKKLAEYNRKAKEALAREMKREAETDPEENTEVKGPHPKAEAWVPELSFTTVLSIVGIGFTAVDLFMSSIVYGHTTEKAPVLVRSPKLSSVGHGCGYPFYSEPISSALKVLELKSEEKTAMVTTGCTIDLAASRYLQCDGTWAPLPLQSSEKPFKLKLDSSANIGGVVYGTYKFEVLLYQQQCVQPPYQRTLLARRHVPKPVKLRVSTLNGNTNNRVQEHDQVSEEGTPGIVAYSTSAEEQEIEFQDTGAIANKRKDNLEMDNSQIGADNNNEDGDGEYMEMSSTQQHPKYYNAPVDLNISNDPGRALKQNTGEEKKTSNGHHKHVQPSANYEELRGDNSEYASLYSRQSKKKTPPHPSDSVNKSETRKDQASDTYEELRTEVKDYAPLDRSLKKQIQHSESANNGKPNREQASGTYEELSKSSPDYASLNSVQSEDQHQYSSLSTKNRDLQRAQTTEAYEELRGEEPNYAPLYSRPSE